MKYQNQQFDQSSYERPQSRHRCGRQRFWQKSCWQGPDHNGGCGGQAECQPIRVGDRYECTRPARAGGPCHSPNPDGSCSQQHLPCKAKISLSHWLKRFNYLSIITILAIIISFSFIPNPFFQPSEMAGSMLNPGPLSAPHATFASNPKHQSCQNCHLQHNTNLLDWFLAAFEHQDISPACNDCHLFSGNALSAHQKSISPELSNSSIDLEHVECVRCHTEHKGNQAELTPLNNSTCSVCHKNSFADFAQKHSSFSQNYPYKQKQSIYFDHLKHIQEYFIDEQYLTAKRDIKFASQAAQSCSACHDVNNALNTVPAKTYASICEGCHNSQIMENQLTIFSTDLELGELSPLALGLLKTELSADPDQAAETFQKAVSNGDMKKLFNLTEAQSRQLWLGLNPVEAQVAVKTWLSGESYTPEMANNDKQSGWFFGENANGDEAIFYQAKGHADPLLKAWLEQILRQSQQQPQHEPLNEAVELILDAQGPGSCGKCHAAGLLSSFAQSNKDNHDDNNIFVLNWAYKNKIANRHTQYNHRPHLHLMGAEEACKSCHIFDKRADVASYFKQQGKDPASYQAAFIPIVKETCSSCHAADKITADCTTCHRYHGPSTHKIDFMSKPTTALKAQQ